MTLPAFVAERGCLQQIITGSLYATPTERSVANHRDDAADVTDERTHRYDSVKSDKLNLFNQLCLANFQHTAVGRILIYCCYRDWKPSALLLAAISNVLNVYIYKVSCTRLRNYSIDVSLRMRV